jgi:triosephosphate isomerase
VVSRPLLVINYKSYESGLGERGLDIARQASLVARELGVEVVVAAPYTMIPLLVRSTDVPVYAQHVDPIRPGRGTGYVSARELALAGASGSIVNHSERRLDLTSIHEAVSRLHDEGLKALVCADTPRAALAVAMLEPDIIAVEPPELIATGISVSRAKPEVVSSTVELLRGRAGYTGPILTGAGVTSGEDARRAVELGTNGVLVASAVMTSSSPGEKIRELAMGLLGHR